MAKYGTNLTIFVQKRRKIHWKIVKRPLKYNPRSTNTKNIIKNIYGI